MANVDDVEQNFIKSQNYFRACRINLDITAEALRQLIQEKLDNTSHDLKTYLCLPQHQALFRQLKKQKRLFAEQYKILNSGTPSCDRMDISLLTLLLNEVFSLSQHERGCLDGLRNVRNKLAHASCCRLENDDLFCETKRHLSNLCQTLKDQTSQQILESIRHAEGLRLHGVFSKLHILQLRKTEMLQKLLVDFSTNRGRPFKCVKGMTRSSKTFFDFLKIGNSRVYDQ